MESSFPVELAKIFPAASAGEDDSLGAAVAVAAVPVSKDEAEVTFAVGAPRDIADGKGGSVYVYSYTALREGHASPPRLEQTLRTPWSNSSMNNGYGTAVALSSDGQALVVGAPSSGTDQQGAAFVYRRRADPSGAWDLDDYVSGEEPNQRVGGSVAVSADASLVAVAHAKGVLTAGTAADIAVPGSTCVAASDDGLTLLVGYKSENWTATAKYAGAARVFEREGAAGSGWTQRHRLVADTPVAYAVFGESCALSGDGAVALVGSPAAKLDASREAGAAYSFDAGTGAQRAIWLDPSGTQAYDHFGQSCALNHDGSVALVGAMRHNVDGAEGAGSAFLVTEAGGSGTLTASDAHEGDYFGCAASMTRDGAFAVVGAQWAIDSGMEGGAAYAYQLSDATFKEGSGGGGGGGSGGAVAGILIGLVLGAAAGAAAFLRLRGKRSSKDSVSSSEFVALDGDDETVSDEQLLDYTEGRQ